MAGLACGIVGLPNVGKSTLFNAINKGGAEAANYPFCTIEPNVGVVPVPDKRVDRLVEIVQPKNTQYATIEFVDIAGLVKGASKGEGKGNMFLDNIRHVNAIVQVVRCFENDNVVHVDGKVDPISDIEVINMELALADLEKVERNIERCTKLARGGDKEATQKKDVLEKLLPILSEGKPIRSIELTEDEEKLLKGYQLITGKPMIYCCNVSEDDLPEMENDYVSRVREYAEQDGSEVICICAQIEEEIAQLDKEEAVEFLNDLGLEESGLHRLIRKSFETLGMISYLTAGEVEVRAWTIKANTPAPLAAGAIHKDFIKGFIRAEVVKFDDIDRLGSKNAAKEAGLMRLEGKEYIVEDGDVIEFRVGC